MPQRTVEKLGIAPGVVALGLHILPVGLERGAELVEQRRRLGLAQPDVPFEAFQEGGGLAEVVIGFEAGLVRNRFGEDPPAEVELLGLGVVALLGVEGERQQVMDVAREEARALGVVGGLRIPQCYHAHEASMATTTRRIATEEDLLAVPKDGRKHELVDGEIRVSPAGDRHSVVALRLGARLLAFVEQHRLGHVLGADAGFRLPGGNVRSPDASFVAAGRFPNDRPPAEWGSLAPDLAVEVISPGDRPRHILDKVGEYLEAGVRLVWVIDPQKSTAVVYRSLTDVREIGPDDNLDGGDVVPGFRCRLREIL